MKTKRKNFDSNLKLHELVATSNERPSLQYICFKNGWAYASDTHIGVKIDLSSRSCFSKDELDMMNGFYLSAAKYKLLLSMDEVSIVSHGLFKCIRKGVEMDISMDTGDALGLVSPFPNLDGLIAEIEHDACKHPAFGGALGLNIQSLSKLANGTGYGLCRLTVCSASPVIIAPLNTDDRSKMIICTVGI